MGSYIGTAKASRPREGFIPNRKLKLLGQTSEVMLLYGTGLRLMECVRLRVKDVDFEQNQVTVREGKGFKDRVTMLPASLKAPLAEHFSTISSLHSNPAAHSPPSPLLSLTVASR